MYNRSLHCNKVLRHHNHNALFLIQMDKRIYNSSQSEYAALWIRILSKKVEFFSMNAVEHSLTSEKSHLVKEGTRSRNDLMKYWHLQLKNTFQLIILIL